MIPLNLEQVDNISTSKSLYSAEVSSYSDKRKERNVLKSIDGFQDVSLYNKSPQRGINFQRTTSRKGLSESVSFPSRNLALFSSLGKLKIVYKELGFDNDKILYVATDIIRHFISIKGSSHINISKTGDNEILLFTEHNNSFNNIIIDSDCDVEFMHVAENRAESYNSYYDFEENFDTLALAKKL